MRETVETFMRKNFGRVIGSAAGLVVALLFLTLGFWRTLLIALCVGAGYAWGVYRDSREEFLEFVERILPKGNK